MSEATKPEGADQLGPVLEFMKLLWAVDHGLQSVSKRMESRFGITGPQRLVVRIVGRFPGISAGALAEILHVHPSTLTGVLRRLETRGMLVRRSDPKDARRALFGLTPRGRKMDTLRTGTVEQAVRRVLARMPDDAVAAERILSTLAAELTDSPDEIG
ncbi:MAG TPA: MarR family transcriptional regulator [Myxococcales bacterium]|nr:MarR family transcriptional regulator [Myxococcales bacterium]